MAYTTINKSTDYFNTVLYTGNGSTQSITGVGFQPDWLWIKPRSSANRHTLYDVLRGTNSISSDSNAAQVTGSGTTTGSGTGKAYSYSVNTTSGFSIVKYLGNGTAGHTIPHHLGAVPQMVIYKNMDAQADWLVYHHKVGNDKEIVLNSNATEQTSAVFNNTTPTSTVNTVQTNSGNNTNDANYVMYSFAEKTGFSKFSSYVGNGNDDGAIIYTGFKPAWFLVKCTTYGGQNWIMFDNKRDPYNEMNKGLRANTTDAEDSSTSYNDVDFLSNGIKIREDNDNVNRSGETYIYMAFAEAPLVGTNNIPATAR